MANKRICDFPELESLNDDDLLLVSSQEASYSVTARTLKNVVGAGLLEIEERAAGSERLAAESARTAMQYSGNPPLPRGGTWWIWNAATEEYEDSGAAVTLTIKHSYPSVAAMEADFANTQKSDLAIIAGDVQGEDAAKLFINDGTRWVYLSDLSGVTGNGIQGIQRVSGTGVPGSEDTYRISMTDGSTFDFAVHNGRDGIDGTGDMDASTYDPRRKAQDVFKYAEDLVGDHIDDNDNPHGVTAAQVGALPSDGTAAAAEKLSTARSIRTSLSSTSAAGFDGSTDVTPGVTGTLGTGNGGTGATSAAKALYNLINGPSALTAANVAVDDLLGLLDTSASTGKKITLANFLTFLDSNRGYVSNPNLLDNWYFADPINQRGRTTYDADGYTIDRWKLSTWNTIGQLTYNSGGYIRISCSGDASTPLTCDIAQTIENYSQFAGRQITVSALIRNNSYTNMPPYILIFTDNTVGAEAYLAKQSSTATGSWTIATATVTLPNSIDCLCIAFGMYGSNGGVGGFSADIKAIKLELGSRQTLAHQENGTWVLNDPPPNKATELVKCQRYLTSPRWQGTFSVSDGDDGYCLVPLPVTLRTIPVLVGTPMFRAVEGNYPVDNVTIRYISLMGSSVIIGYSGFLTHGRLYPYAEGQCLLSAEL